MPYATFSCQALRAERVFFFFRRRAAVLLMLPSALLMLFDMPYACRYADVTLLDMLLLMSLYAIRRH